MGQNFIVCDREQELLLPPSLRDWLPEDHLAWCVLDAVAVMDLAVFYGAYRRDGWGRAAHDPAMMVALLLYAYAIGERSSRQVERRCREDVAFRVITANQVPDHATIARFRVRHQEALAGLFSQVLALCARAGLVSVGVVALDGTKVHANASGQANRSYEQIAREMLAEADRVDAVEDERFADRRGDEPPSGLADRASRRARLAEAKRQIEAEREAAQQAHRDRLEARAEREAELGHRLSGPKPKAPSRRVDPQARANVTDPDSRSVKTHRGFMQGYNAQAVATSGQVIIAADVMIGSSDGGLLEPMLNAAVGELAAADIDEEIDVALADAGYWSGEQIDTLVADGIQVLVAPDGHTRGEDPSPQRRGGRYDFMRRVLATDRGRTLYRQRGQTIEPIFGQTKHNRRADRFQRRGLAACRSEWRLIAATHNLLKYWRATTTPTAT